MTMVLLMLRQIAIMALLVLVGIYLSRRGFLSEQGTRDLGAILIRVIIPVVIVKSFITPFSAQRLQQLGLSFLLALLSYVLAMALSWLVFGKRRREGGHPLDRGRGSDERVGPRDGFSL